MKRPKGKKKEVRKTEMMEQCVETTKKRIQTKWNEADDDEA